MMSLESFTSSAQERSSKAKRRLLDFDESDQSIEEDDELDAELSRSLIDKIRICNSKLFACMYREESALEEGEDLSNWWRSRSQQFPKLWRLAWKYLCIAATNTESERSFSWSGFLLNKRRLSLSGEGVSLQLFLKDNIKL